MTVTSTNPYAQLGIAQQGIVTTPRRTELGQDDFLRLMAEQMRNQDPTKPLDSTGFLAQLAQFSTVKGIQGVNDSLLGVGAMLGESQALQAASMVGRDAYLSTDHVTLDAPVANAPREIRGVATAGAAGPVVVTIKNAAGQVVRTLTVEATGAGDVDFSWDGKGDDGTALPAGEYKFSATSGGTDAALQFAARIDSVSFTPQGMVLNVHGQGAVTFDRITRIA
ncbi:flagellar hook assembly protein FlgD [Tahibacter soli]|jgi:flagellar basal-body rod modification protein FlgD|uniref:Basal-body rod modification protein FlgD n=1 Tax=Tahibacter soli TaxID=2983605 RepID=A0A9X3YJT7_9GAMM|nr:flagellar hook capping FlgD N-terminal domain-containing protein [Tahibacter soli]MDC8012844.1 flagellar hook capping FlgD N-terminal domain-containing protein [Tahibacter soli]